MWALEEGEINAFGLTSAQRKGIDYVPKRIAERIVTAKERDNLVGDIESYDFHDAKIDGERSRLAPNTFVLVRAFIMPGKFKWTPVEMLREVQQNKREFEFWEKFAELVRAKADNPEYWKNFKEKVEKQQKLGYLLEDIIDRELFRIKGKEQFADDPLATYKKKREFDETPEPEGEEAKENKHRFVIQRHKADRAGEHFDLRLENDDGAMTSWAIPKHKLPKGKEKLLAMKTEDHPISYNKFEGTIPKGEYGAGTVEVYDSGTYEEIEWGKTKIVFKFKGKKEKGRYKIFRTEGNKWMIMEDKKEASFQLSKRAGQTFTTDDRAYSVDMLIEITKDNKIETVPTDTLEWNLGEDTWGKNISPEDVLENPKKYKDDAKRIEEAELKYPILIYKGEVIDGYHRLAKAVKQGKKTIKVRIVTDKQMDAARIDDERIKELSKRAIQTPHRRQTTTYSCGAAALRQILALYNIDVDEKKLMSALKTTYKDGTAPKEITRVAKEYGLKAKMIENMTLQDLKHFVKSDIPIIAMLQWSSDGNKDLSKTWADGHYVVVSSVNNDKITLTDPATDGKTHELTADVFLSRWHDVDAHGKRLIHTGIIFTDKKDLDIPAKLSKRAMDLSEEEKQRVLLESTIERRKLNTIMRRERKRLRELGLDPICVSSTAARINVPGVSDIDFQIGTDDIEGTCKLLEKEGFEFSKEYPGAFIEYSYKTPEGIDIDLKVRPKSHVRWQIEGLKRILEAPQEERDKQILEKYKALKSGDKEKYKQVKYDLYRKYMLHPPGDDWSLTEQEVIDSFLADY